MTGKVAAKVAMRKNLAAVKGPGAAAVFGEAGCEGFWGPGNTGKLGGKPVCVAWHRIKRSLHSCHGGGGQYKMYKSMIFINFINRSKKENKYKMCMKLMWCQ